MRIGADMAQPPLLTQPLCTLGRSILLLVFSLAAPAGTVAELKNYLIYQLVLQSLTMAAHRGLSAVYYVRS